MRAIGLRASAPSIRAVYLRRLSSPMLQHLSAATTASPNSVVEAAFWPGLATSPVMTPDSIAASTAFSIALAAASWHHRAARIAILICARRVQGWGHVQQSRGPFHPEGVISATAMPRVRPAASRAISAHAGGTLFRCVQARVPFLPRLAAHGVMPISQVEGLLREPGRHLSRFAIFSFRISQSTAERGPAEPAQRTQLPPARPHWGTFLRTRGLGSSYG